MNAQDTSSVKEAVIKKLDDLPSSLLTIVLNFLDGLLASHGTKVPELVEKKTDYRSEISDLDDPDVTDLSRPLTTWDQFFDELQKLPPTEGPPLSSLTKQERKDLITEHLVEKYEAMGLDFSS